MRLTGATIAACLFAGAALAQDAEPKRVLVFGDSNSWGWVPIEGGVPTQRYPTEGRQRGQF